jgi:ribosome-associated protein
MPIEQDDENFISKSQKKRDMLALQALGEALVELSTDTLKKLELPEDLRAAVMDAKRIPTSKHGGYKRQMQYIGRVMRGVDAAPIAEQLEGLNAPSKKQTALHHLAEKWRDRLLTDATAIGALLNDYPEADRTALERLVAGSHDERAKNKPPRSYRQLYQALHELVVTRAKAEPDSNNP